MIPAMTDPMGFHWHQPSAALIEIDDTHALMTEATFKALPEYSITVPTGVYPGKMWRRHDGIHDFIRSRSKRAPVWMLCWYGDVRDGQCQIHFREVLLV
jgi:hypothetical protein